ncbi:cryptochrome/photolyase family protein [Serinibacter salmoneus]|uniref:Deoxyribodipyrimidine photo-lyase type I n=1 Tax=Serinibacter salmoneus TaxID=556530 RepID=A0A2A9CY89_9MICO|nr:deoxyribodipyrimidine photo-lyase [Serinibacter salmoneus]PFG19397.1 deoxyribodipyrimidine photo-lyase type I [Serinibacter salmoneus]
MPTSLLWLRRDLRIADNPALLAAAGQLGGTGGPATAQPDSAPDVLPVYVLDPRLWSPSGDRRRAHLVASLRLLGERLGGMLLLAGDPVVLLPQLAREVAADQVHAAADVGPYGRDRDERLAAALAADGRVLMRTGSPYAVAPGRVRKGDGEPYRVFTPFRRAWLDHGWRAPAPEPQGLRVMVPRASGALRAAQREAEAMLEAAAATGEVSGAGELAALERWAQFLDGPIARYEEDRNRPDRDGTSQLSVALKWGEVHPRTLLADLAPLAQQAETTEGAASLRSELGWREFLADVLWHQPDSARTSMKPAVPESSWVTGRAEQEALEAWQAGRTGYPIVDAGMRQLARTGWMHGRVRMIVASFLVKDLHVRWQRGARYFMTQLHDADLASNQHNWQWVAGSGTDAAPFFRVFNPVRQGERFDPDGAYVRRWVPELAEVQGKAAHQPWPQGGPRGYPAPIVDHDVERKVALAAHQERPR